MCAQQIIMNYTVPPSFDDLEAMARGILSNLPEEFLEFVKDEIELSVEDLPDEALEQELSLADPYDLVILFRGKKEISPGVESKNANGDDKVTIYRRSILDLWCDEGDDLMLLMRQLIIEELGRAFDFSDDEIVVLVERHDQIML